MITLFKFYSLIIHFEFKFNLLNFICKILTFTKSLLHFQVSALNLDIDINMIMMSI